MKKLLGLTALVAVLVLSACGGSSSDEKETVCTAEEAGMEFILTAKSEDGEITSLENQSRMPVSELGEEAAEMMAEQDGAEIDGDYLVITETIDLEDLQLPTDLEEFIEQMEATGFTCS
jgi:hypothetical protein